MITLQKPGIRHQDAFIAAAKRSSSLHEGFVSPPISADRYRGYLRSLRRNNQAGFLVTLSESHEIVGVVNVSEIVLGLFQSAYLGYYAFVPHAGRGLMRRGLQQVICHCFDDLRLHRLEANIQPDNERSIALVKSLGFENEGFSPQYLKVGGRWRDHQRWAIRSEQWR